MTDAKTDATYASVRVSGAACLLQEWVGLAQTSGRVTATHESPNPTSRRIADA